MSFTKPFSEKTAQDIDSETKRLLKEAEEMARRVITENRAGLEALAERLLDKETVFSEDLEDIFGAAGHTKNSNEQAVEQNPQTIAPEIDDTDQPHGER
jgi:cell division protease FtsH